MEGFQYELSSQKLLFFEEGKTEHFTYSAYYKRVFLFFEQEWKNFWVFNINDLWTLTDTFSFIPLEMKASLTPLGYPEEIATLLKKLDEIENRNLEINLLDTMDCPLNPSLFEDVTEIFPCPVCGVYLRSNFLHPKKNESININ